MAKQVQWRRGTTEELSRFTGALGEITVDVEKHALLVHDGVTAGGFSVKSDSNVIIAETVDSLYELPEDQKNREMSYLVSGTEFYWDGSFKPRGRVKVEAFGADPTGERDSLDALTQAIASGFMLDWGEGNYRVTGRLGAGYTLLHKIDWVSNGASVTLDSEAHIADLLNYRVMSYDHTIKGRLVFDGSHKCNVVFGIRNDQPLSYPNGYASFDTDGLTAKRARRESSFRSGAGVLFEGAFHYVILDNLVIEDCVLGAGAGVSGSVGIIGAAVTRNSGTGGYTLYSRVTNPTVRRVYSEDPLYDVDQDGIQFFGNFNDPDALWSSFDVVGGVFENCWGRSIKCQMATGRVSGSSFMRSEGPTGGGTQTEISFQGGMGTVEDISLDYRGTTPFAIVTQRVSNVNSMTGMVRGISGRIEGAVLAQVLRTYSPPGLAEVVVEDVSIDGDVGMLVELLVPNDNVKCTLRNMRARLVDCGVRVITGGVTPQPANVAHIVMEDVSNLSENPVISVIQRVPGNQVSASLSSTNTHGFYGSDQSFGNINEDVGPPVNVTRVGPSLLLGPSTNQDSAALTGQHEVLPAGVSAFTLPTFGLYLINIHFTQGANAIFSAVSSGGGRLEELVSGGAISISTTTQPPETGSFRIWCPRDGTLCISNETGGARRMNLIRLGGTTNPLEAPPEPEPEPEPEPAHGEWHADFVMVAGEDEDNNPGTVGYSNNPQSPLGSLTPSQGSFGEVVGAVQTVSFSSLYGMGWVSVLITGVYGVTSGSIRVGDTSYDLEVQPGLPGGVSLSYDASISPFVSGVSYDLRITLEGALTNEP